MSRAEDSIRRDGGPAFPAEWEYIATSRSAANGMTLRDYFAAKAMQAGLTNATLPGLDSGNPAAVDALNRAAVAFYMIADAMLKARGGES